MDATLKAPAAAAAPVALPVVREEIIADDREQIVEGDQTLLIVDDDPYYARILLGLARDKGFKGIVANRGNAALTLARQYQPTAITLDIFLPDMLGWTVLNNLKLGSATRHIPVLILSVEEERRHGLSHGAFSYMIKPATTEGLDQCFDRIKKFVVPRTKRLLVVEDNEIERQSIVAAMLGQSATSRSPPAASTAPRPSEQLLDRAQFDCCVLDLRLPDMSGFELIERLRSDAALSEIPVVVFTGKELSKAEEIQLRSAAKSIVLKDVQSPERLFDETALFLHRVVAELPEPKRKMLDQLHNSNEVLKRRKVLIVDDDARNIFALTTLLENQEMDVISATNGRQAIDLLAQQSDVSVVLMDIMMPEMDGFETMRRIRKDPQFGALPILALTAKAMKGDREKCLRRRSALRLHRKTGQHQRTPFAAPGMAIFTAEALCLPCRHPRDKRSTVVPQPRRTRSAPPVNGRETPVNILIVDDEVRNLDVLESISSTRRATGWCARVLCQRRVARAGRGRLRRARARHQHAGDKRHRAGEPHQAAQAHGAYPDRFPHGLLSG